MVTHLLPRKAGGSGCGTLDWKAGWAELWEEGHGQGLGCEPTLWRGVALDHPAGWRRVCGILTSTMQGRCCHPQQQSRGSCQAHTATAAGQSCPCCPLTAERKVLVQRNLGTVWFLKIVWGILTPLMCLTTPCLCLSFLTCKTELRVPLLCTEKDTHSRHFPALCTAGLRVSGTCP